MIGVIVSVPSRTHAVVSAPHLPGDVRLNRCDLQTDVRLDRRLIGKPLTFNLQHIGEQLRARNAWLCSCDFMAVAAENRGASKGMN